MTTIDFSLVPFPWGTETPDGSIGNVYAANGVQVLQVQHIPFEPRCRGSQENDHRTALTSWVSRACDSHNALVAALRSLADAVDLCGAAVVPLSHEVNKVRALLNAIENPPLLSDAPSMGL